MIVTADIRRETLENGLTLLVESMPGVKSAAFSILAPAGVMYEAPEALGTAAVLSDLMMRGAGSYTSKQLSAALDNLGVERGEGVSGYHMSFGGATLATNIPAALRIYGDIIRRPALPEDECDWARAGVEQTLRSIEDEPRQKVMIELRRRCYDDPWGRPVDGTLETLPQVTYERVGDHHRECFRPNGLIIAVAGAVEFDDVKAVVDECFGDWQPFEPRKTAVTSRRTSYEHLTQPLAQTHIGIAYPSVTYGDPEYYAAWAAVSVLSGGMSSRLFTEVREKRGLCYSVYAVLHSLRDDARVLCYAGTTAERAQATLDVTRQELERLTDGITENELARCKAMAKSALVMQQESTASRAGFIARDWFQLNRVRQLEEIQGKIDGLTVADIERHIRAHPPRDFTVLTIGPEPLEFSR